MIFDRVIPEGKNAYFPFQMSAASLSPTSLVYIANDAAGADSTLGAGVTVDDMGGGLYALKVTAASMSANGVYYAVITAGTESVRIPMWAYAPFLHVADVLAKIGATGAGGLFEDNTNLYAEIKELQTEIGDVSAQTFTGAGAQASVAVALATIFNKVNGVQGDLDNATDGLGALKTLIDGVSTLVTTETGNIDTALTTIDTEVGNLQTDVTAILADTGELQTDWANGGRLDLLLDKTVAASEAAEDLIGLAGDSSSTATVFGKVALLSSDIATVGSDVDAIKAAVEHATYGLSAIETKVLTVDTVVDGIATSLASASYGLSALKDEINANETKIDTIDTVVDGIASEIGDVSTAFGGGSPPATVAAALKAIFDANADSANVWDDAISGSETAGTAGKRLYDLSEDWKNGGRLDLIIDELTTQGDTNETKIDDVQTDVTTTNTRLGSPIGADFSADIAAIKSVVDTLQVSVNARLQPSVPSEIFSAVADIRVRIGLSVFDGETGALEDPDTLGTNGDAAGQVLVKLTNVGGGTNPVLYDAASAGSLLAVSDLASYTTWTMMKRVSSGYFEAYAVITAYFSKTVEIQFFCKDSDPVAAQQTFITSRYLLVRSPVSASGGGGAF
jgi:hypothetical protein